MGKGCYRFGDCISLPMAKPGVEQFIPCLSISSNYLKSPTLVHKLYCHLVIAHSEETLHFSKRILSSDHKNSS